MGVIGLSSYADDDGPARLSSFVCGEPVDFDCAGVGGTAECKGVGGVFEELESMEMGEGTEELGASFRIPVSPSSAGSTVSLRIAMRVQRRCRVYCTTEFQRFIGQYSLREVERGLWNH